MSYHCDTPRKTHLSHVDPSLLLGYYFTSLTTFDEFLSSIADVKFPLFSVMEQDLAVHGDDFDVESLNESL